MLDPSIKSDLIELLSSNFTTKDLSEFGRLIIKNYDVHELMGVQTHVTVAPRKHAEFLINYCEEKKKTKDFLKLLIETDETTFLGKTIIIKDLENFLLHLAQQGFVYDPTSRSILDRSEDKAELVNWGSLRDGRTYEITALSIDVVGNSKLVKKYGMKKMEGFYYQLWRFLKNKLADYDGRLWSWAGDGGICAFTSKDHVNRAVLFAIELQCNLPIFNMSPDKPITENIQLRIGIDSGKFKFYMDTGQIVSDTVNYAAHLEKKGTEAGQIGISDVVMKQLNSGISSIFIEAGEFEQRMSYISFRKLDDIFADKPKKAPAKKGRATKKKA